MADRSEHRRRWDRLFTCVEEGGGRLAVAVTVRYSEEAVLLPVGLRAKVSVGLVKGQFEKEP